MKLITAFELAHRSERELTALFTEVSGVVARAAHGSEEWRVALMSLQNIRHALSMRRRGPAP